MLGNNNNKVLIVKEGGVVWFFVTKCFSLNLSIEEKFGQKIKTVLFLAIFLCLYFAENNWFKLILPYFWTVLI